MEEDIIKEAREKRNMYLEEKRYKRRIGEGDGSHLFVWRKRIIHLLDKKGKQTVDQITSNLIKDFPKDYNSLNKEEINNSVVSTLKSLLKKSKLKNIRGVRFDLIYGHGMTIKNNGEYWWLQNIDIKPEEQMKKILDLFKK